MPYFCQTLEAYARLLSYPREDYIDSAEFLYVVLQGEVPEAAAHIADFGKFVEPLSLHELEETFARTFDVNPTCALEIGWHLFGEEYARGALMVRVRGELQQRGIEESGELPDHMMHVLALIAAMSHEEAKRFVQSCVFIAIDKMQASLEEANNSFVHVIASLAQVLEHRFGRPSEEDQQLGTNAEQYGSMPEGDPLRNYPMPEAPTAFAGMPGSTMPGNAVEVVPLQADFHASEPGNSLGCGHGGLPISPPFNDHPPTINQQLSPLGELPAEGASHGCSSGGGCGCQCSGGSSFVTDEASSGESDE